MPTKTPLEKIASGVTDTINKSNKVRTTPKLARFAKLPGGKKALRELYGVGRKARDRLRMMQKESVAAFAKITEDKTKEYAHWGMTPGDKENHWTDNVGVDQRIAARTRAIEKAKKSHARGMETEATSIIEGMRGALADLNRAEPLHHSTTAILLRQTMSDPKDRAARAEYMQILSGAGNIAIDNAIMDCCIGEGNKPLGAAVVTLLEKSKTLRGLVKHTREDVADFLVGDEYWECFEAAGLFRYFVEQCEVSCRIMEGKEASRGRAGRMKSELQDATAKLFNEDGDTVDSEGKVLEPENTNPTSDDFYEKIRQESIERDKAVAHEKRRQAAVKRKAAEDDVAKIINRTEAEEDALYGGAS